MTNREDIIAMAREAWRAAGEGWVVEQWFHDRESALTRFATLVAASEREACAKVCEDIDTEYEGEDVLATWCANAIRERSANVRARGETKSDTWVGLTQQDIEIAFDDTREGGGFDDFARAIEAKLKAKNSP